MKLKFRRLKRTATLKFEQCTTSVLSYHMGRLFFCVSQFKTKTKLWQTRIQPRSREIHRQHVSQKKLSLCSDLMRCKSEQYHISFPVKTIEWKVRSFKVLFRKMGRRCCIFTPVEGVSGAPNHRLDNVEGWRFRSPGTSRGCTLQLLMYMGWVTSQISCLNFNY